MEDMMYSSWLRRWMEDKDEQGCAGDEDRQMTSRDTRKVSWKGTRT